MTRGPATALRRWLTALAVLAGLALVAGPALDGAPNALASGALVAAVLSGTAFAAGLALAAVVVVLLVAAPPRAPAVRWDAAVAVVLDDQPGRPGRARPRAPGAGTSPRRPAR